MTSSYPSPFQSPALITWVNEPYPESIVCPAPRLLVLIGWRRRPPSRVITSRSTLLVDRYDRGKAAYLAPGLITTGCGVGVVGVGWGLPAEDVPFTVK